MNDCLILILLYRFKDLPPTFIFTRRDSTLLQRNPHRPRHRPNFRCHRLRKLSWHRSRNQLSQIHRIQIIRNRTVRNCQWLFSIAVRDSAYFTVEIVLAEPTRIYSQSAQNPMYFPGASNFSGSQTLHSEKNLNP